MGTKKERVNIETFYFPSKILLFGEQTILTGSKALSIPFNKYTANWTYGSEVNLALRELLPLLPKDIINIDFFDEEVNKYLVFDSAIPQKAGLGSSGALTAALYKCFSRDIKSTLDEIQNDLARIESIFHGKSSGTDALVSFADQSIHTSGSVSNVVELNIDECPFYISLINSAVPRTAKKFIKLYLDKVDDGSIDYQLLIDKSDAALEAFVSKDLAFMNVVKELSIAQLNEFDSFIPSSILSFWEKGISSDSYYCKLCGAGGGGYFLCFSKEPLHKRDSILPVNY
jgi:mevalonate kinase